MAADVEALKARFAAARVARLATVRPDGRPHLVPVTFALRGEVVVTAVDDKPKTTTDLQRLRNVRHDGRVSLLADEYRDDWSRLWWVRIDGTARVLDTDPGRAAPVEWLREKYPQYRRTAPAGPVIWTAIEHVTGWSATP